MEFALILLVVAGAVLIVTGPLRERARAGDESLEAELAELEAAKEAKYREIRDAELDHETGKLSDADWRSLDRTLRARPLSYSNGWIAFRSAPSRYPNPPHDPHDSLRPAGADRRRVIFLVLLHSGKDAGMSGAFGVGVAGGSSGGSLMERNLDRWTIVFAILFAVNTIAILKT